MATLLRKTAALMWLALPPFVLSALVHMADPDIAGWRGLAAYPMMWSVALFGVLALPVFCLCLCALVEFGWTAFLIGAFALAVGFGAVLTVFGSGASTMVGHAQTLVGCIGVVLVAIFLAVIPAAAFGWPRGLSGRRNDILT